MEEIMTQVYLFVVSSKTFMRGAWNIVIFDIIFLVPSICPVFYFTYIIQTNKETNNKQGIKGINGKNKVKWTSGAPFYKDCKKKFFLVKWDSLFWNTVIWLQSELHHSVSDSSSKKKKKDRRRGKKK
jgi:hypothetical protein